MKYPEYRIVDRVTKVENIVNIYKDRLLEVKGDTNSPEGGYIIDGDDCLMGIENGAQGLKGKAIFLSDRVDWVIVQNEGELFLVPLEKEDN
jgi:hypothetical protein